MNLFSVIAATGFRPISATGGIVTEITVDGMPYRVHSFTSGGSDSFVVSDVGETDGAVEYLVVGSTGASGLSSTYAKGGGGGGGEVKTGSFTVTPQTYGVTVGQRNGISDSSIFGQTALAGESGSQGVAVFTGSFYLTNYLTPQGDGGASGNGNAGGFAVAKSSSTGYQVSYAGGGGGASASGANATASTNGAGGAGVLSSIRTGVPIEYGAGNAGGTSPTVTSLNGIVVIRYPLERT